MATNQISHIRGMLTSSVDSVMDGAVFGNSLLLWGAAAATVLVLYGTMVAIRALLSRRFRKASERHPRNVFLALAAGMSQRTATLSLLILALAAGGSVLTLDEKALHVIGVAISLAIIVQAALWASVAVGVLLPLYLRSENDDPAHMSALSLLEFLAKLLVWTIALLLVLDNIGIDITALVAGLGIGGVAVALAVQNVLGDLLSSLSIVLDKPFEVGDFIITNQDMGSVERIGIKTTRVRSISGEQLVFSNSDLLSSRIRNFKRMYERRVVFTIGVVYQTSPDQLKAIPTLIREAVEAQERTRFDRSHFKAFGNFSLDFETVYYVLTPDYLPYMDIQQAINLRLFEAFAERGIEFAYPTQTIFLEKNNAEG
ncbi:MAG: mechanosensitive ion channel family protein [Bdellovibrionales bacterium]|nr:mechanosensitive ion channel family protein [Bdellovibrionales bacterium]